MLVMWINMFSFWHFDSSRLTSNRSPLYVDIFCSRHRIERHDCPLLLAPMSDLTAVEAAMDAVSNFQRVLLESQVF